MNRTQRYVTFIAAITIVLGLLMPAAHAQQPANAAKTGAGKKELTFHGKVEKVDATTKKVTINGEKVEGWMGAMVMAYPVDKEEVLKQLKVGDRITAKVYAGDMVLHDVHVVPPAAEKKAEKSEPKK